MSRAAGKDGPVFVPPQLPTLVEAPPEGGDWIHEIKYDGYRTELVVTPGLVQAFTRNGHDWSDRYPRIVAEAADLPCRTAVIDGEAIVQDERGVSDFTLLRKALGSRREKIVLFAFDLLHLDGADLRARPLRERRALLRGLLAGRSRTGALHFSEEYDGTGAELFAAVDQLGLEGIVSKKAGSRYRSGRSESWLKTKCFEEAVFEVVGVDPTASGGLTALLATRDGPVRQYAGRAAVSLPRAERERFFDRVSRLASERPPADLRIPAKARWLQPGLSVRVRYLRGEETLRHASLLGIASVP